MQVRDLADPIAARVVDPDLRPDVAPVRDLDHLGLAPGREELDQLLAVEEALVVEGDDQGRRPDGAEEPRERLPAAAPRVEGALALAAVDPLAGAAVGLGLVPADQGLPDVVVAEVLVLVVGRVDVGDVAPQRARGLGRVELVGGALARRRSRPCC